MASVEAGGDPAAALVALMSNTALQTRQLPALEPAQPFDGYLHGPPKPACHAQRVRTADAVHRLRATRDGEIESMLRLLCTVFDTESATCALLTGECIYIVGGCGVLYPTICPDRWGFCGWSFINAVHELLVVEDMDCDARFSANFFVLDPQFAIKFYVAAPLVTTDGHRLGTLCVMGGKAQRFDATRAQVLANLAEMMVRQLERKWVEQLEARSDVNVAVRQLRPLSAYTTAFLVVDTASSPWRVLHMNVPAIDMLGVEWLASYDDLPSRREGRGARRFEGRAISDFFDLGTARAEWRSGSWEFSLSGVAGVEDCAELEGRQFAMHFKLCSSDALDPAQPLVGIPSFVSLCPDGFGCSLFFVRVEEDATAAAVRMLRAQPPAPGHPAVVPSLGSPRGSCSGSSRAASGDANAALLMAGMGVAARGDSAGWLHMGDGSVGSGSSCGAASGVGSAGAGAGAGAGERRTLVVPPWELRGVTHAKAGARGCKELGFGCPIQGLLLGPLLGRGSYGRVYRGIYKGHPVAVKIIDCVQLIARDANGEPLEVSLMRGLGHASLMRTVTHAYGDAAAAPGGRAGGGRKACWMVFEYCDRGTIADAVVKGWFRTERSPTAGATDLRQVGVTALEVAGAMAYLHERGVMHGDLCGGNVMLQSPPNGGPGFCAKVGDFGLCRHLAGPAERLRLAGDAYGTVTHVAPEVLLEGAATKASDVYSFGVMLHEMLTGARAWAGLSHAAIVLQVSAFGRQLAVPDGLPPALEQLLSSCLSRDPAARPGFAAAADALARWLQETREEDLSGTVVGRRRDAAV